MQRSPPNSPHAISREAGDREPAPAVVLEFGSPSAAITATPVPSSARGTIWVVASMVSAWGAALGLIHVDRVVTAPGRVVSKAPTIVVQPLETAIVRSIDVHEGQQVRSGDLLARLDSTFAAADVGALAAQVTSLEGEVMRLLSELDDRPFRYVGSDPWLSLQALIFAQRESERSSKLESYRQKIAGLKSAVARASGDASAFGARLAVAQDVENMRRRLEHLELGSRLNSLIATDNRLEIERSLSTAVKTGESAQADLAAMIAERDTYLKNWRAQTAQAMLEQSRKLSDARESLSKARLRRQLVELRADRDAIVLTIAKISEGSVLQPSDQLLTMVPTEAPLEIEADISGHDNGFVRVGDSAVIKFDTFPFSLYGAADGTVRMISPDSFASADQQIGRAPGAAPSPQSRTAPFYRSRVTIEHVGLHDVPPNFRVAPGMPITADIKVGRHTVLNYLLGRVLGVALEGMREP